VIVVVEPSLNLAASQIDCRGPWGGITKREKIRIVPGGGNGDGLGLGGSIGIKGLGPDWIGGVHTVVGRYPQVRGTATSKGDCQRMISRIGVGEIPGFHPIAVQEACVLADVAELHPVEGCSIDIVDKVPYLNL